MGMSGRESLHYPKCYVGMHGWGHFHYCVRWGCRVGVVYNYSLYHLGDAVLVMFLLYAVLTFGDEVSFTAMQGDRIWKVSITVLDGDVGLG